MIKAIETDYAGHRFRSRLEARWAVFFNEAGVDWHYEPEGFVNTGSGFRYLPDFHLPKVNGGIYFEVKGTFMDEPATIDEDVAYLFEASGATPRPLVFAVGSFPRPDLIWHAPVRPGPGAQAFRSLVGVPMEFGSPTRLFSRDRRDNNMWTLHRQAYLKAAGARFEHGERP